MLRALAIAGALALAAGGAADCGGSTAEVHFSTINISPATPVKGQPVSLVSSKVSMQERKVSSAYDLMREGCKPVGRGSYPPARGIEHCLV